MKWIFAAIAVLFAAYFLFSSRPETKQLDPNKPWLSLEAAPDSPEEKKEARAEDPRSLENRILQKDYCATSDYFRFGRHGADLGSFLQKVFPTREEERRNLNSASMPILSAQFSLTREEALAKLRGFQGADTKLLLGMLRSGQAGLFQGNPSSEDLREALVSLDEAEDLNPTNALVPVYRAMVMQKQGMGLEGIAKFLKEELPKRERVDSPLSAARLDYLAMVSRDPLLFAAAAPTFAGLEDAKLGELSEFLGKLTELDQPMAELVLSVADRWGRSELESLHPGLPDHFSQLETVALAAALARRAWPKAFPGQALPERFEEKTISQLVSRHRDRNPIEGKLYFGAKREEACGPKWREAVEADFEMVRDRLRKR